MDQEIPPYDPAYDEHGLGPEGIRRVFEWRNSFVREIEGREADPDNPPTSVNDLLFQLRGKRFRGRAKMQLLAKVVLPPGFKLNELRKLLAAAGRMSGNEAVKRLKKARFKTPQCPKCGGKARTAGSPETVRKFKCTVAGCGHFWTALRRD